MPPDSKPPDDSDLPLPELDFGVVTSGLCDGAEAQADFDEHQAGLPPQAA